MPLAARIPSFWSWRLRPAAVATPRAMLVEDNEREREALATFLRKHGVDVVTAGDGEEAIDYLDHHSGEPDVLLLDMGLPRCDGAAVIRAVRSRSGHEHLKIIVISGHAPEEYDLPAGSNSFDHWFHKPIDPSALLADLNRDLAVSQPATAPALRLTAADYHALAALGVALIAMYLSLVPLSLHAQPFAQAWARFSRGMTPHAMSASDFVGNVLLFIPLGYFVLGAQRANAPRSSSVLGTASALLLCGVFSMCLEFAQVYTPARTADINDIMAQFLGTCIGACAWSFLGRTFVDRCALAYELDDPGLLAGPLLVAYLVVLMFLPVVPLNVHFQPSLMWWRFDVGLSRAFGDGFPSDGWEGYLWELILFLPAGILAAGRPARNRLGEWQRALVLALLSAGAVKAVDLLARTGPVEPRRLVAASLAFLLGWKMCRTYQAPATRLEASLTRLGLIGLAIGGWFIAAPNLLHEMPTTVPANAQPLLERLDHVNWLPLSEACSADPLVAFRTLCRKGLVFVPMGLLISLLIPRLTRMEYGLPVFLLAIPIGLLFELGLVGAPREGGISPVLFEAGGAWFGFALAQVVWRSSSAAGARMPHGGPRNRSIRRTLPC